jgi:hypothetical protein
MPPLAGPRKGVSDFTIEVTEFTDFGELRLPVVSPSVVAIERLNACGLQIANMSVFSP